MGNQSINFKKAAILSLLVLNLSNCNTEGHRGTSDSIKESKSRETYINTYELTADEPEMDSLLKSQIEEVFLEYGWFVKRNGILVDTTVRNISIKLEPNNNGSIGGIYDEYYIEPFSYHSTNGLTLLVRDKPVDSVAFNVIRKDSIVGRVTFTILKD